MTFTEVYVLQRLDYACEQTGPFSSNNFAECATGASAVTSAPTARILALSDSTRF